MAHVRSLVVRTEPDEETDRRALRDTRPPTLGSATRLVRPGCVRPFIALAAQQNGIANFGSYYPPSTCTPGTHGSLQLDPANLGTIPSSVHCRSCDTVFTQFGADFYDIQGRPVQYDATLLRDSLRQFGFQATTNSIRRSRRLGDYRPRGRSSSRSIARTCCSRRAEAGSRRRHQIAIGRGS